MSKHAVVIPVTSIPTVAELYQSSRLDAPPPEITSPPPSAALNSKVSLIQTSITTLGVTSIVNAANNSLLGGGGVDGAIHAAAGPSLLAECRMLNGCATGSAKITSAHALPSAYIIHSVGPIYSSALRQRPDLPAELLRSCYRTSLQLAAAKGGSVAFSCLSTGVYGYPSIEAAEVATQEVRRFLEEEEGEKLERVVFCCFEGKDVRAYEEWLPKTFPPVPSGPLSSSIQTGSPNQNPISAAESTNIESEDWEPIEKPVVQSTDSLYDEGEKIEADASEDEVVKVEAEGEEGSAVDLGGLGERKGSNMEGKAKGGPETKHGLLKDW